MKNIAIITAKGGNRSLKNKNIRKICGKPSIYYPITAAQEADHVDEVFVTTECSLIKEVCLTYGAKVIDRPKELAQPYSNIGDVILHASKAAQKIMDEKILTVTILLGNTVMLTEDDINNCIEKTISDEIIDSCMTVWKAEDDHPYRAMVIDQNGYLASYKKGNTPDTNRQSYPEVFYYDQGPWTVRMTSLLKSEKTREGPAAWWWMGKNCAAIERLWVTGRDTHTQYDIDIAEWWLKKYRFTGVKNPPNAESCPDEFDR